ncbi:MAG: 2-oxo acid dehydrogenase subunit E2 [Phycisphaerales bacterium]|nr:2-oxo acid dehydrogenase subunit E2 [Phycisphaerales bacterium]
MASTFEFKLPDLGEGVHEGRVLRLFAAEGAAINEDSPLMEVETDKAAVEIPCPRTGTIAKWHVAEKDLVFVGNVMVTIAGDGQATAEAASVTTPTPDVEPARTPAAPHAPATPGRRTPASPSVRRLAREHGVDLSIVSGSGPGGRLIRADVLAAAQQPTPTPTPQAAPVAPAAPAPPPAAPTQLATTAVTPAPLRAELDGVEDTNEYGAIVRSDLTQARKTIARVMSEAWATIPHVTDCNDADITQLEAMRREFTDPSAPERRITTLAFVIRAVCRALVKHPILNATIDWTTQSVVYHRYVNIGIGIETPRGLVAPVIRDAHTMGVGHIADHLAAITHNARAGSFSIEDTRGGTYTISNAGAMGRTRYSTPIITPGQVACLAVGRARKMPWVVGDAIEPRLILPLSHSMDHRLVDGGREIPFIEHVMDDLEHPMRFAL